MNAHQCVRRHRRLAAVLAVAVTTSPIGFAPPAAAHGVIEPQEVCAGPEIASGMCNSTAVQPISGHLTEAWRTDPHGSPGGKLGIAAPQRQSSQSVSNACSKSGTAATTTTGDSGSASGAPQRQSQTGTGDSNSNAANHQ